MGTLRAAVLLLVLAGLACGESSAPPPRDDELLGDSTTPRPALTPVVVIPGILGSRLVDADNNEVWGSARALRSLRRLEYPAKGAANDLRATGLIDTFGILGRFEIHAYGGLISFLKDQGFVQEQTLFTFPYDWRQSNFHTAAEFKAWVSATPALQGGQFNIVAHSMGGLVASIFASGQPSFKGLVITLGTPFWGAVNAFGFLVDGLPPVAKRFARLTDEESDRISRSLPSVFELLPTYPAVVDRDTAASIDVTRAATWGQFAWLSASFKTGAPFAFAEGSLREIRRIADELAQDPPTTSARFYRFAGTIPSTPEVLRLHPTGKTEAVKFTQGDETVVAQSASAGRGDAYPSIWQHQSLPNDPLVRGKLRDLLIKGVAPPQTPLSVSVSTLAGSVSLASVAVSLPNRYYTPRQPGQLLVTLLDGNEAGIPDVSISAWIDLGQDGRSQLSASPGQIPGQYLVPFQAPAETAFYAVGVTIPEVGDFSRVIAVLPAQ